MTTLRWLQFSRLIVRFPSRACRRQMRYRGAGAGKATEEPRRGQRLRAREGFATFLVLDRRELKDLQLSCHCRVTWGAVF